MPKLYGIEIGFWNQGGHTYNRRRKSRRYKSYYYYDTKRARHGYTSMGGVKHKRGDPFGIVSMD